MSNLFFGKIQRIFVARPARYVRGAFYPTLRAAPGTCVGLRLCRTPCDVATRWKLLQDKALQTLVKITMLYKVF